MPASSASRLRRRSAGRCAPASAPTRPVAGTSRAWTPRRRWPAEVERIRAAGFTAMKWRVGRYPIAHEARLLEKIRDEVPDDFQMMADGNAGYTFPRAIEMGAILDRLGFVWFEEPVHQRGGYQGYDRLAAALDIALAGGEILDDAERVRSSCSPAAVSTSSSPNRSSVAASPRRCGSPSWPPSTRSRPCRTPRTTRSGSRPPPRSWPACPTRTGRPRRMRSTWNTGSTTTRTAAASSRRRSSSTPAGSTIPDGPGLGVEIDEDYLRHHAVETRVVDAAGARTV